MEYMDNQDVADPFGPTTFHRRSASSRKFLKLLYSRLLNPSGIWNTLPSPTSPTTFRVRRVPRCSARKP